MTTIKAALEELTEQEDRGREKRPSLGGDIGQFTVDSANRSDGTLNVVDGINCPICKNKGEFYRKDSDGRLYRTECECMKKRNAIQRAKRSGLEGVLSSQTFCNFITLHPWQKAILEKAEQFTTNKPLRWFAICGSSGSGKTHICTAISGVLIDSGINLYYMRWRDEADQLKMERTSQADTHSKHITKLKTVQALYIDDFLKTGSNQPPTIADLGIAFDIISYRDMNNLTTIISSERSIQDILVLDEALGSRIYARTEQYGYYITVSGQKKNYRLMANKGA